MIKEQAFIRYQSNWRMYLDYLDTKAHYKQRWSDDESILAEWQALYAPYRTNLFKFKLDTRYV